MADIGWKGPRKAAEARAARALAELDEHVKVLLVPHFAAVCMAVLTKIADGGGGALTPAELEGAALLRDTLTAAFLTWSKTPRVTGSAEVTGRTIPQCPPTCPERSNPFCSIHRVAK